MAPESEKPKTYHHQDLRRILVDAGNRILETAGADAVTLRAVAREAGVSHAAPYRHFQDRDALLRAVAAPCLQELATRLREAAGRAEGDARARVRAIGRAYLDHAAAHPEEYRLVFGPRVASFDRDEGLASASREVFGVLVTAVEQGQAEGTLVPGPAAGLATFAFAALHGLAGLFVEQRIDGSDRTLRDRLIESFTGRIIDGIGVARQPRSTGSSSPTNRGRN